MAKTYVLGIGGTGSRILQSLMILLSAGVQCNDEIVPIIIDLDTENGDTDEAFKMVKAYTEIRKDLFNDDNKPSYGLKFFGTKVSPFSKRDGNPNYTISCLDYNTDTSIKFAEHIGYLDNDAKELLVNNLEIKLENSKYFIDSLFDNFDNGNENESTELFLN